MVKDFDIGEFRNCSCLRLRRATRIYDGYLEPTGLGANQLTLLVMLHGAQQAGKAVMAVSLAEYFGADPTTLSRSLKPLIKRGLIAGRPDPGDGRSRLLRITAKGEAKLREAGPHWRKAQVRMKIAMGKDRLATLHDLLPRRGGLRA